MPTIQVLNAKGDKVRDYSFGEGFLPETANTHLMHLHVVRQLRHARQGSSSTLTRAEVRGGGKKPWKQKGTGRARTGSTRSPLWKGGGVIFGPKPRRYTLGLSVKSRRLALRSALLSQMEQIVSVETFGLEKPSTKTLAGLLKKLGCEGKTLLVVKAGDENVTLSARNLKNVKLIQANNLGVKDLLWADRVVASEDALRHIEEVFQA
ncbi:MAG: 50S ribosomal protein L4 [Candidatus Sericytochromatia bacterium]